MSTWLSGLTGLEVLTLSDIQLTDLAFLESMENLARLDVANCGLSAFTGENSNIQYIANRYATLRILDLSNNDMRGYEEELQKLRSISLLTVLYADNVCDSLDAYTLTYSMPELKYISLESCGISSINWLCKYNNLAYVDLAGSDISSVAFGSDITNASLKTLEELYLDTNVSCSFANAYYAADVNIKKLSLEGVHVEKMENLPYLDSIQYLNLSNTGLVNLTGDDQEMQSLYSIARYSTVKTIDVSGLSVDISILEDLPALSTVYAVGAVDSERFYENNLHALQRLYNRGVTCYLYDKAAAYTPVAAEEGSRILNLLEDISCDVTVAADNVISDNNPFLVSSINDYAITWSVSNSDNYEIVNNYLSVKDYTGIEDEDLTITAQITVYPDQAPVTRSFTIHTNILRASTEYFGIEATGYSMQLTRDKAFTYVLSMKTAPTEGFANPVKPVVDYISYTYTAVAEDGTEVPYANVLTVGENYTYMVASNAPLGATATIMINIGHITKDGVNVNDIEQINVPVTVADRTFKATLVANGGSVTDVNGVSHDTVDRVEESLIFSGLTVERRGYIFQGWYTDPELTQLFSATSEDALMPTSDITLYAKWQAHSFNLIFDANGGTVAEETRLVLCDTEFGELPVPERTGYRFEGWFTATGEQISAASTMATAEDVTVAAKWSVLEYTASWNTGTGYTITVSRTASPNANAVSGILTSGATVYYGDVLSVSYTASAGYTLGDTGSTEVTVTGDVAAETIFASATLNSYTVSWNNASTYSIAVQRTASPLGGAASGALSSGSSVFYGDELSITYTAATGYSIDTTTNDTLTVTGNVTNAHLSATVKANNYTYNIVYKSSNGTALGTGTVTYAFATTNTVSPKTFSGYTSPAAQTVTWDATSKTITFVYTPTAVTTTQTVKTGTWWTYNSSPALTYTVKATYVSRTATSATIKITWTNTIVAGKFYGYTQSGSVSLTGSSTVSTGTKTIANSTVFGSSSNTDVARSSSFTSTLTVPLNSTAAQTIAAKGAWSDANRSGSWTGSISIPAY